jgi:hypothetical protein
MIRLYDIEVGSPKSILAGRMNAADVSAQRRGSQTFLALLSNAPEAAEG